MSPRLFRSESQFCIPAFRDTTIKKESQSVLIGFLFTGADDEARTRYLHLGKVALYQMSYIRKQTARVII